MQKKNKISSLLVGSLVIIMSILTSCQSLDSEDEQKKEKIINAQLAIATSQLDRGSPKEAITTLNTLLKEFPKESRAITLLGMSFISLGNNDKALEHLRQAFNIAPTTSNGLNLSSGLIAAQNYDKALNVLRTLVNKKDEEYRQFERIYHNLGYVYEKISKYNLAITNYKKALKENPRFYLSHLQIGKVYKKIKNNKLALEHFEKATSSCESCYESAHLLATEYINNKQYSEASKILKDFLKAEKSIAEDKASAQNLLSAIAKLTPQPTAEGQKTKKDTSSKNL